MKKQQKFIPWKTLKKELLADPEVKRAYDEMGPEYALINKLIELRITQGLTQKQLAKKLGTKQSAISRLEQGTLNPRLSTFFKLARALDAKVKITIS